MKCTLLALLLAGLFSSCKEDDQSNLPSHLFMDNGDVTVLLNGEDVPDHFTNRVAARINSPTSCYPGKFSIASIYSIGENINRMTFSIDNVPLEIGKYTINRVDFSGQDCSTDTIPGYFFTSIADGDVSGDNYLPIEEEDNFVSIDTYNQATGKIAGTFQMTLAVELEDHRPYKTVADAPDTIRLTQGQFSAVVRE